ncbi:uroporphyrinogen-III synthase, partial [Streptomyces sp. MBT65]|nr:uroporphyrinogen-III synthase [Streptomyces sp. MBT65]
MYEPPQRPESAQHGPLSGFTVGVTAARRADELGALLQRRGAAVLHAPALRIVPLADDSELLAATKELIDLAPDVVVATT